MILNLLQRKFIYKPANIIYRTPDELGLPFEWVEFNTSDGLKLTGWLIRHEAEQGTLLFCHGNNSNIANQIEIADIYYSLGFSVLLFDYRGYGRNDGNPSEKGTYRDVEAAWQFLTNDLQIPQRKIIVSGKSLGGPIAAWCAANHTPGALVIESTFTSMHAIGNKLYPWLPVRILLTYSYNTQEYVRKVSCPVLVIHSKEDQLIPISHGERIFDTASEPKEFLTICGSHGGGFLETGQPYIDGIDGFLKRHFIA